MGLSSNIIWHQTKFDASVKILTEKRIICSYSLETIKWEKSKLTNAFPMISFCNLPISDMGEYLRNNETKEYTGKYGNVTIGFKKEFMDRYNINPVWYQTCKSNFIGSLSKLRKKIRNIDQYNGTVIWNCLANIKNCEGSLIKYNFSSYRFSDEKEVRYVPSLESIKAIKAKPFLKEKEYIEYKGRNLQKLGVDSAIIPELYLEFDYSDIEFILVGDKKHKNTLQEILKESSSSINIITYKQVIEEFIGIDHSIQ